VKARAILILLSLLIFAEIIFLPLNAVASTPRRGEFCANAKIGLHLSGLTCKKVGKYNRWE